MCYVSSVAIGCSTFSSSSSDRIPAELLLSLDWFGKRQTNQEKATRTFLFLELNSCSSFSSLLSSLPSLSSAFGYFSHAKRKQPESQPSSRLKQKLLQFLPKSPQEYSLLRYVYSSSCSCCSSCRRRLCWRVASCTLLKSARSQVFMASFAFSVY